VVERSLGRLVRGTMVRKERSKRKNNKDGSGEKEANGDGDFIGFMHSHCNDDASFDSSEAKAHKKVKIASEADPSTPSLIRLHNEIISFCKEMTPSKEENDVRAKVLAQLQEIVVKTFPEAQLFVFGSYFTGLATGSSDIDITILGATLPDKALTSVKEEDMKMENASESTVGNLINGHGDNDGPSGPVAVKQEDEEEEREDVNNTLYCILADALKAEGVTSYIEIIKAKVPIIKVDMLPQDGIKVSFDICFDEYTGLLSGAMIKQLTIDFAPMKYMVIVLKYFLLQRSLHDVYTGGVSNFILSSLVASFLQHRLRIHRNEMARTWNLGSLLMDFLDLYGCSFNYTNTQIVLNDTGTYRQKSHDMRKLNVSIVNPIDKNQYVGHGCFNIGKIRRAFEYALQLLTMALVKNDARVPLLSRIQMIDAVKGSTKNHILFNQDDMDEKRCITCEHLGFPVSLQITHTTDKCMFDTRNSNFSQKALAKAYIKYEKHVNGSK
jgi:DNA polymerase sigma